MINTSKNLMYDCSVITRVSWTPFCRTGSTQRCGRSNREKSPGKPGAVLGHRARWLFVSVVLEENVIVVELALGERIDL